jgi:hypothetical protein
MIMKTNRLALDASVRSYDVDGRLRVATSHISKACVSPYMGSEIPGWEALGLNPYQVYALFRAPTELKKAEASFNNIPILIKHEAVSAADPKKDLVVGTTGSHAAFDGESGFLSNSLSIWDDAAIKLIESGAQKELSCGYRYVVDMRPGSYNGDDYHGVMRAIVGNHVALVDRGRAGPDVVVGDRAPPTQSPAGPQMQPPGITSSTRKKEPSMKSGAGVSAVMNYLKKHLSEDQIAELADIMSQCASGGVDGKQGDPVTMAMLQELDIARRETAPVLGAGVNDPAMDSASSLYAEALRAMSVNTYGVRDPKAFKHIFRAARRHPGGRPPVVMDTAQVISLHERFPHAARIRLGG